MRLLSSLMWATCAGALIPLMAVANARLGREVGESLHAPPLLFAIGLLATTLIALATTGRLPDPARIRWAHPETLLGGCIVAFYVTSATLLAPRLGVGRFIVCAVSAQVVVAALVDHFGALGAPLRPLNGARVVGISLLLLGVYLASGLRERG